MLIIYTHHLVSLEQGSQTQIAPRAKLGQPKGRVMMLTQQCLYLDLTGNTFYILFPAKCVVSCGQIISSCLYVLSKELVHLLSENF